MARIFKMSIHQKIDRMHIRLMGDFDGNSAFELLIRFVSPKALQMPPT